MPSVPMPRATRAAIVVAFLLAFVTGLSVRSGPIMLLGICLTALLSAIGMLRRRAWSAFGFAFLLVLSTLAVFFFAITGQSNGGFVQVTVGLVVYLGIAGLFLLAGHGLALTGAYRGSALPWILIALLFSVPFLFYRPVSIPNAAMEPTLMAGDFLLVDRFAAHSPVAGEVVAFHYPLDRTQIFVRRIAGVPGDHLHFTSGKLYRNGAAVAEPYLRSSAASNMPDFPANINAAILQSSGRNMLSRNVLNGEVVVPAGKYFVLGDARDASFDSRHWGFINLQDMAGRPRFIYDSLAPDPADKDLAQPTHAPTHRWDRLFKTL